MSSEPLPQSEIILYQTEDGRTRIQCRFENKTLWLSQAIIAELFQKDVRTINEYLGNIFDEGELNREATIRKYRMVRQEGGRQVARDVEHYNLDAILAVGFRVRSHRGTHFRQWAIGRLNRLTQRQARSTAEFVENLSSFPAAFMHTTEFTQLFHGLGNHGLTDLTAGACVLFLGGSKAGIIGHYS